MLSFFRKKNSDTDVVTKVGAVRSVVVGVDVSQNRRILKKFCFVYIFRNLILGYFESETQWTGL